MVDNVLFNKLLQKIAAEKKFEEPEIEVKAVSTGGANFTSNLFQVTIADKRKANRKALKLFAKIAAMNENFRNSFENFSIYEVERLAYTELFQIYRNFEEKHGLGEEHKLLLPRYYGADTTPLQESLVLEDLGSRGFELYSRFKSVDWPYASAAVTELAKFHALSFAYKHENPAGYRKLLDIFQTIKFPDNGPSTQNNVLEKGDSSDSLIQLALKTVKEENKEKLKKFLDTFGASMAVFHNITKVVKHTALIHTDFRPSNMLYRKTPDGNIELIPVDYQGIQPGCPAGDLVFFIACGTDGAFRARYYKTLVDHYHSELGAALGRFGADVNKIYPRDDFEFELKQKLPYALVVSVVALPILTAAEGQAPKIEDFDLTSAFNLPTGDLYRTRLNEIVEDLVAWGILTD